MVWPSNGMCLCPQAIISSGYCFHSLLQVYSAYTNRKYEQIKYIYSMEEKASVIHDYNVPKAYSQLPKG